MTKDAKYKMSEEHLQKKKEELHYLETVREKEVAQQIKEARSFGDLTENSEYEEAKTEQGRLYSEIAYLKDLIENAVILKESEETGIVGIKSKVKIFDCELDEEDTYEIVGSQEADPSQKKISSDSPLGKELMGKGAGERVRIEAPDGFLEFEIREIF
jgi:transcription elongation factor GreA